MRPIFLFLLTLFTLICQAQKTETYYDYSWKPSSVEDASYISTVKKTDSGWLRNDYYSKSRKLQMQALYADEACKINNGDYTYYHPNARLSSMGRMVNDELEGICMKFHSNGSLADSGFYKGGQIVSERLRWHENGYLADSIRRVNDSVHVQLGWFEDGMPAYAGFLVWGERARKWQMFHHNGTPSALIIFAGGKQVKAEYFEEDGKPLLDTSHVTREATFKGGEAGWKRYVEKNLYWPTGLTFNTAASVTVGITFAIDENGKVTDAAVTLPFHETFDRIALDVIKKSPNWQPEIAYNRKIKVYRRQAVTFSLSH